MAGRVGPKTLRHTLGCLAGYRARIWPGRASCLSLNDGILARIKELAPPSGRTAPQMWRTRGTAIIESDLDVSVLAWGARGPKFKSRQPDQIYQRLADGSLSKLPVLESKWSPNADSMLLSSAECPLLLAFCEPEFLRALSPYINPTNPTNDV